jgi:hypothetical protein
VLAAEHEMEPAVLPDYDVNVFNGQFADLARESRDALRGRLLLLVGPAFANIDLKIGIVSILQLIGFNKFAYKNILAASGAWFPQCAVATWNDIVV